VSMELISDKKIEDTNSQRSHMVGLGWYDIFEEYPNTRTRLGSPKVNTRPALVFTYQKGSNKVHVLVNVLQFSLI
jgi:hypothetical protein